MGERLNIEITKNGKCLANAYYHWSGYTDSALALAKRIMTNLDNEELVRLVDNDLEKAVALLATTGAGFTEDELNRMKVKQRKRFGVPATDRNNGLIAISEHGKKTTRRWQGGYVAIDIETKKCKFDVFWKLDEDEDREKKCYELDFNLESLNLEELNKFSEMIKVMIHNKDYIFKIKDKEERYYIIE